MAKAASIRGEIEGGLSFEDAAKRYSEGPGAAEGGDPGDMVVGELAPELQAIARKLTPGTVSDPLNGGTVVLLMTVEPSKLPPPSEASAGKPAKGKKGSEFTPEQRQEARRRLEQMKVRAKLETFMDDLKKNAVIKKSL
jgi:hypothetical protein